MWTSYMWTCARKDLLRRSRDPWAFLLWMGIPILLGGLISLVSGGSGGPKPRGKLLVADHDDSLISRAVISAFGQKPLGEFFEAEQVEESDGRARMNDAKASALIVLPEGFGAAVLEDRPTKIELVKNPSQRILPKIAEDTLSLLCEAAFYAQRIAGDRLRGDLRRFVEGPPAGAKVMPEALIADFSVEINRTVERLSKYLIPPVIEVETVVTKEVQTDRPSFGQLFFPSMLFMALFFIAQGLSDDIWREKAQGTLRRALTTPQSIAAWLAGKVLAGTVLIAVIAAVALPVTAILVGFQLATLPLAFVWVIAVGAALIAFMTLLQMSTSTQRGAHLLSNTLLFPLIMLGGSFMPFAFMPKWLSDIGQRTPNGWALVKLESILYGRADAASIAVGLLACAAAIGLMFYASCARLRGRFAGA